MPQATPAITVRYPDVGLVAIHDVTHDLSCPCKVGGMDDGPAEQNTHW